MEFLSSFLRRHFPGKPVVESRNIGGLIRLTFSWKMYVLGESIRCVLPHLSGVTEPRWCVQQISRKKYSILRAIYITRRERAVRATLIHFTTPVHAKCRESNGKSLISCHCSSDFCDWFVLACVSSWWFCSGTQISFACVQPPPPLKQRDTLFEGRNSCTQAKTSSTWTS